MTYQYRLSSQPRGRQTMKYAELPVFKYQTFDPHSFSFAQHPVIPADRIIFSDRHTDGSSKPTSRAPSTGPSLEVEKEPTSEPAENPAPSGEVENQTEVEPVPESEAAPVTAKIIKAEQAEIDDPTTTTRDNDTGVSVESQTTVAEPQSQGGVAIDTETEAPEPSAEIQNPPAADEAPKPASEDLSEPTSDSDKVIDVESLTVTGHPVPAELKSTTCTGIELPAPVGEATHSSEAASAEKIATFVDTLVVFASAEETVSDKSDTSEEADIDEDEDDDSIGKDLEREVQTGAETAEIPIDSAQETVAEKTRAEKSPGALLCEVKDSIEAVTDNKESSKQEKEDSAERMKEAPEDVEAVSKGVATANEVVGMAEKEKPSSHDEEAAESVDNAPEVTVEALPPPTEVLPIAIEETDHIEQIAPSEEPSAIKEARTTEKGHTAHEAPAEEQQEEAAREQVPTGEEVPAKEDKNAKEDALAAEKALVIEETTTKEEKPAIEEAHSADLVTHVTEDATDAKDGGLAAEEVPAAAVGALEDTPVFQPTPNEPIAEVEENQIAVETSSAPPVEAMSSSDTAPEAAVAEGVPLVPEKETSAQTEESNGSAEVIPQLAQEAASNEADLASGETSQAEKGVTAEAENITAIQDETASAPAAEVAIETGAEPVEADEVSNTNAPKDTPSVEKAAIEAVAATAASTAIAAAVQDDRKTKSSNQTNKNQYSSQKGHLERRKGEGRLLTDAFGKSIERAREEQEIRHSAPEYKEKQRRHRQKRDAEEQRAREQNYRENEEKKKTDEKRERFKQEVLRLADIERERRRNIQAQEGAQRAKEEKAEEARRLAVAAELKAKEIVDKEEKRHRRRKESPGSSDGSTKSSSRPTRPQLFKMGESETGGPLLKINMAKAGGESSKEHKKHHRHHHRDQDESTSRSHSHHHSSSRKKEAHNAPPIVKLARALGLGSA